MDPRFEVRRKELLAECEVAPAVFRDVTVRLDRFMEHYVDSLVRREQREHAHTYVCGMLSDLQRKNVESVAYRHDQERLPLQKFIGFATWDDGPLRMELARQVGAELGEADGVLVFDPSAFPKKGRSSACVARQWCGRLGKVDNCQVGVYMGYVSSREHALVDMRLYMPKEWARDKKRRAKAGIPKELRYQTRHALCLEMLAEKGDLLPHGWITGDDELGRPYHFRRDLQQLDEQYLLAIPSNILIRDLDADPPAYQGKGPPRKRPWQRVETWRKSLPGEAWTKIDVRDGEKGPLVVEIVKRRVAGKTDRRTEAPPETLVVIRRTSETGAVEHDYYLSNAPHETPLNEFARVAKAHHRIEECIQRGKSEAGLADYEVRTWRGWHHHQTLSLIASWFLVCEARRGKKMDTGDYRPADPRRHRHDSARGLPVRWPRTRRTRTHTPPAAKSTREAASLESA